MVEDEHDWIAATRTTYSGRLTEYERQADRRYPGIFDAISAAAPTIAEHSPAWCPLPIGAVIALGVPPGHASMITAVAAWRMAGRHVAYLAPSAVPAPVKHVPVDEIQALPVRCLYLATTDGRRWPPQGFFAWLEYDVAEQRTEVRLQIDRDQPGDLFGTLTDPVHVVRGTLRDAVLATQSLALMRGAELFGAPMPPVGPGTDNEALIAWKVHAQGGLLAAVACLSDPAVEVVDAGRLLGETKVQDWSAPRTGPADADVTLWLASRHPSPT